MGANVPTFCEGAMGRMAVLGLAALAAVLLAGSPPARAQYANIEITVKDKQFQPAELKAPANARLVIRVINRDPIAMEFESHEMKVEKVVSANSEGLVRAGPFKPGRYEFFDDFNQSNKGVLVVE